MSDTLKEWKLVQGALGLFVASGLLLYVASGKFKVREWIPLLPTPAPPDTLIFHIDTMRQHFVAHRFTEALREAEAVLVRKKGYVEAVRVKAACLLRLGRFSDAERVLRPHIAQDKFDLGARIDLAVALQGQGKKSLATGVLLRVIGNPLISPQQEKTAQSLLLAMTEPGKEPPLFTPPTPEPTPSPAPPATPSPAPALTIRPPRDLSWSAPTSPWLSLAPTPLVKATPLPEVAAFVLPKIAITAPLPTPEPDETTTVSVVDLDAGPPPPTPRATAPSTLSLPRKILPTLTPPKKAAPTKKKGKSTKRKRTTRRGSPSRSSRERR